MPLYSEKQGRSTINRQRSSTVRLVLEVIRNSRGWIYAVSHGNASVNRNQRSHIQVIEMTVYTTLSGVSIEKHRI